jgi:sporulation-control protein spo0M
MELDALTLEIMTTESISREDAYERALTFVLNTHDWEQIEAIQVSPVEEPVFDLNLQLALFSITPVQIVVYVLITILAISLAVNMGFFTALSGL